MINHHLLQRRSFFLARQLTRAFPSQLEIRYALPRWTRSESASRMVSWSPNTHSYPQTRREEKVDTYQSTLKGKVEVPEPYGWLEDDKTEEYKEWCAAQAKYTEDFLENVPSRAKFEEALRKAWEYDKISLPSLKQDGYYYYNKNRTDPQSKIYRIHESTLSPQKGGGDMSKIEGELFFDPNTLSKDGTVALKSSSFSPKTAKYWAYQISVSGSDWSTIRVRHMPYKEGAEEDELNDVRSSSIGWRYNEEGFFYCKYPGGGRSDGAALYYHRIGTPQSEDVLVYKNENEKMWWDAHVERAENGRWAFLTGSDAAGRKNLLYAADLQAGPIGSDLKWHKLADDMKASRRVVFVLDGIVYVETTEGAPKGKIVAFDLSALDKGAKDHIPERKDAVLSWSQVVNERSLMLCYNKEVLDHLYLYPSLPHAPTSSAEEIPIPPASVVQSFTAREEGSEAWLSVGGMTTPAQKLRLVFSSEKEKEEGRKTWEMQDWGAAQVDGLNPDDFESKQVWYTSKDGTKVPVFLTKSKRAFESQDEPSALIYGYGGFSVSLTPAFSVPRLLYIQHYGGYLAIANIRGGDEFGEEWHEAGMKNKKQNVFDDFIACAEFLQREYNVSPSRTAIHGGSNGGLLTMACANQRPELYGSVLSEVGVHDMLKFHKFTIGHFWRDEYGCSEDPDDFDNLIKYSPLHNVNKEQVYPSILITTADHDDRVVPAHSLKMISTLQHDRAANPNPLLVRLELSAGHGAGKPTEKVIQEALDKYTFLAHTLQRKWIEVSSNKQ
ncbi:hypothetical protein BT69DRAFT_1355803 [Atractiella rhizophila]|nr:hypothetical protein BT69DRAFT_1355803 [Atractiella rhizophila]